MLYNLSNRVRFRQWLPVIFSTILLIDAHAQGGTYTRPPVTDKWEDYHAQVKKDSTKLMVELGTIPGIVYDLRYATVNNFMRRLMYPAGTKTTFLRKPAAEALEKVQWELADKKIGLKIYDAYRPYSVTVKFWELVKDERYVANPSKGSGHNRGVAVDLTLIDAITGKELDMGTGFDNFTDSAHHSFTNLPADVLKNRLLLKTTMEKYGFKAYADEWWHYSIPTGNFEVLDIPFKKLIMKK